MSFHSGKKGKVEVNASSLPVTEWEASFSAEKVEVTNTESQGYAEYVPGVIQGECSLEALWDDSQLPNQAPADLSAGNLVTVDLFCGNTTKKFSGTVLIERMQYNSSVRGKVKYRCQGVFNGSFQQPS